MTDRIAVITKLLTDLAAVGQAEPSRITAGLADPERLRRLTDILAEHYPGLSVNEVREAAERAAGACLG